MNEETLNELEALREEVPTETVDTGANAKVETDNDNESDNKPSDDKVEEKEEFKPWKKVAEKKEVDVVPYQRFKEINDERKAYQSKLEEYERELAELKSAKEKIEKIKGPEDINIGDYDDVDSYMKDVIEATKRAAIADVERNYQEREIQRVREAQSAEIVSNFQKNVEESIKYNPEIKEAVSFIDNYADQLDPRIAKELLLDENAGEVIYDIVTNQDLLTKLFKGDTDDVIRLIHKMSAKIDKGSRIESKAEEREVPAALVKETLRPKTFKSESKSTTKDPEKMTIAEYRKYVNNGYK